MPFRTIISLLLLAWCCGQAGRAQGEGLRPFQVVCYNVENYFDCVDDSLTDDSEFLPGGIRGWNHARYRLKQAHVARVLAAIAGWDTPALVGLCEVESRKALTDLVRYSPLRSFGYEFIHFDSPDVRGVDVALLYHPFRFFPIRAEAVPVTFADPDERSTRDILHVEGTTMYDDTLHVLLHHAPSRMGGEAASAHRRLQAATVLRGVVDSLLAACVHPNVLVMGDFNDYPTDRSLIEVLQAHPVSDSTAILPDRLYNLAYPLHVQGKGTYQHEGEWGMLDQIIVSGSLLDEGNRFSTRPARFQVLDSAFLLCEDERHLGRRPFRTYHGMRHLGGYSDHLPVYVDFY